MKTVLTGNDLIDSLIECARDKLFVEMPNGHRIPVIGYRHDNDKRGESILVLYAGRARGERATQREATP